MLSRNIHCLSEAYLNGESADENRRGGRFNLVNVKSQFGDVLDLSHCGALIVKGRLQRVPKLANFPLTIGYEDIRVTVTAKLVRKSKVKGIGTLLGLELIVVSPEQREAIRDITRRSRRWEVMPISQDAA